MLICIDGLDQAGKDTQCRILAERLRAPVFASPDDQTFEGKIVREYLARKWAPTTGAPTGVVWHGSELLDHRPYQHSGAVVQCAYATEKLMKQSRIRDAARQGHAVLNRWMASAFVYSSADGVSEDWLIRLMRSMLQPDVYVLLDIEAAESVRRKTAGRDLYEAKPGEFRQKLVDNYRRLWLELGPRVFPGPRWVVVDGSRPVEEVARGVWGAAQYLGPSAGTTVPGSGR